MAYNQNDGSAKLISEREIVPSQRFQFSIRTLLFVTFVVAVFMGWVANERRKSAIGKRALDTVIAWGVAVSYDRNSLRSHWLSILLGENSAACLASLDLSPEFHQSLQKGHNKHSERIVVDDIGLQVIRNFSSLRSLKLCATDITDTGLKELDSLKRLDTIDLSYTSITSEGILRQKRLFPDRKLTVTGTAVSPSMLQTSVSEEVRCAGDFVFNSVGLQASAKQLKRLGITISFNNKNGQEGYKLNFTDGWKREPSVATLLASFRPVKKVVFADNDLKDADFDLIATLDLPALTINSDFVSQAGLTAFASQKHSQISRIELRVSENAAPAIAKLAQFRTLRELHLYKHNLDESYLSYLAPFRGLNSLYIRDSSASDRIVYKLRTILPDTEIVEASHIQFESFSGNDRKPYYSSLAWKKLGVSTAEWECVESLNSMGVGLSHPNPLGQCRWADLNFGAHDFNPAAIEQLARLPALEVLLVGFPSVSDANQATSLSEIDLAPLTKLQKIREVVFFYHTSPGKHQFVKKQFDFSWLSEFPDLWEVYLHCPEMDLALKNLAIARPNLGSLAAHCTKDTSVWLEELSKFKNLEVLNLSCEQDADVTVLSSLPHLRKLTMRNYPKIKQLRVLEQLTHLESLYVSQELNNDQEVEILARMKHLHHLTIQNQNGETKNQGINRLRQLMPETIVRYWAQQY